MENGESITLEESEVRSIVRLLGDVMTVRGTLAEARQALMDGLLPLIGADAWIWGVGQHDPNDRPFYVSFIRGNIDDRRFALLMEAVNHPEMERHSRHFSEELARTGAHLTRLRQQMNPDNSFIGSEAEKLWLRADIAAVILSCRPLPNGGFSSIGIYRTADKPLFSEREARIAHIVLSEVKWLHMLDWQDTAGRAATRLAPRLRTVVNLLIDGWSRKQIATHLDLSLHTVDGYIKQVYRHYAVHSQSELVVRFSRGDGGDIPAGSGKQST